MNIQQVLLGLAQKKVTGKELPNKKKIVALAGVSGGFLAILCAYGYHFWQTNRKRLTQDSIDA